VSIDRSAGQQARLSLVSFDLFGRRYLPALTRYLISQAGDSDWASQIAQESMQAARDNWDDLLTFNRPDVWLFTVATRKLRRLEARARERGWPPEDLGVSADLAMTALTDSWVGDHLELLAALRALPRRQAEVIGLHYLAGYQVAEAAGILGIGEGTARTHLRRGLVSLGRPGSEHEIDRTECLT
jgi:RNA polymerase sigma-70 factor, ECF subfamily